MRLNFTLISAFFFASAVLADRSLEHRSSQLNIVEKRTNATSDSGEVIYTSDMAGAGLNKSVPTFWATSGTFKVPHISGPTDSAVGIWVGIDLGSQCGTFFLAGVVCNMTSDGPFYTAAAEWLPQIGIEFSGIEVSPGDLITFTVSVASDQTTGYATVENFGDGTKQTTYQTVRFSHQRPVLCQLSAEWIVSKVGNATLANFDVVSFTKPLALGDYQKFTPAGSVIFGIENETVVYADEDSVTIWYV